MGLLGAKGGPRNWEVAGTFVDLLGRAESFARTPHRQLQGPYGIVFVMKPEDLLVERVLVSVYPQPDDAAQKCAKMLADVALRKQIEMDWAEVKRVARRPEYPNLVECETLVREAAHELKLKSPLDPN